MKQKCSQCDGTGEVFCEEHNDMEPCDHVVTGDGSGEALPPFPSDEVTALRIALQSLLSATNPLTEPPDDIDRRRAAAQRLLDALPVQATQDGTDTAGPPRWQANHSFDPRRKATILVNGVEHKLKSSATDYEEVTALAGEGNEAHVTYHMPSGNRGVLNRCEMLNVEIGTAFSVITTGNA